MGDEPAEPTAGLQEDTIVLGPQTSADFQPTDPAAFTPPQPEAAPQGAPAAAPSEAPAGGMRRAVLGNAAWTVIGFGVMQVLRLGSNIILARLLAPEIFGVMALVYVFLQALHMFSDVGLNVSIIQSPRGEDSRFRNTAWTMQVLRGFILWLTACLIAWPVALFYEDNTFLLLLPVVGFNEVISGFDSTTMPTLRRRLQRARLVLLEIGTYVSSMAFVLFYVAFVQPTVWALVMGSIFSALLQMGISHRLIRGYRNRFDWEPGAVHELLHFGKWIFINTLCTFFAAQTDRLIVGKIDLTLLGVYHFAAMLASMPGTLMLTLSWQLVFPLYSRLHQAGEDLRAVFGRVHPAAAGIGALMVTGLIGAGPTLVRCLYDARYQEAGWILPIIAIGAWFQILETLGGSILFALGKSRAPALSNAMKVVALLLFVPVGYWRWGFSGVLAGFVAADLVRYLFTAWAVYRQGIAILLYDVLLSLGIVVGCGAAFAAGNVAWAQSNRWLELLAQGSAVVLVWGVVGLIAWSRGMFRLPRSASAGGT